MDSLTRLNKFIASNGVLSRRKIDELIEQGRVTVNGKTVTGLGVKINPDTDKVSVDGQLIKADIKKIYVILNKPQGIITSVSDDKKRTTVIDLVKIKQKIFPIGRLDYNTSGLLLLTNDGELTNKLTSARSKVYKTYYAELSRPLEEKHKIKLMSGVKIEGKVTAPAVIKFIKPDDYTRLLISIFEGRNRQIHNMFEHFGYFVRVLERVEYAGLKLGSLKPGEWRNLTPEEIKLLMYSAAKESEVRKDSYKDRDKNKSFVRFKKKYESKYKSKSGNKDIRKDESFHGKRDDKKNEDGRSFKSGKIVKKKEMKGNFKKVYKKIHKKDFREDFPDIKRPEKRDTERKSLRKNSFRKNHRHK